MNVKSIHFPPPVSDDMIRAILANRKTVTRRVVKDYALEHLELDTDGSIMLDWLQGTYSASMAFAFRAEDVEELETVAEEVNEPDPPPMENAAPPRWRQVRDKKQRRRKGARKP